MNDDDWTIKGRGEVSVTHIYILGSHNCGERKSIVSLKESYHRFPNIGEILKGDMIGKLRKVSVSKDFLNRECNCISTTKVEGKCAYGG